MAKFWHSSPRIVEFEQVGLVVAFEFVIQCLNFVSWEGSFLTSEKALQTSSPMQDLFAEASASWGGRLLHWCKKLTGVCHFMYLSLELWPQQWSRRCYSCNTIFFCRMSKTIEV